MKQLKSQLFLKNYVKHGKGNLIFSEGKELLNWNGNFIMIVKNGAVSVYDCFSNRPLCSLSKSVDLSTDSVYEFRTKKAYLKLSITDEYGSFDIVSEHNKTHKPKNDEFIIRDSLCEKYVKSEGLNLISTEYVTDYGILDVLAEKDGIFHIFEIKRKTGKTDVIGQLLRYAEYFHDNDKDFELYAVAEDFSAEDMDLMKVVGINTVTYTQGVFKKIF